MSAVDHLSYKGNEINGKDGKLNISFPTFNFHVTASANFEFHVTPGKGSQKPILWKPEEQNINNITIKTKLKIQCMWQKAILPH